MEQDFFDLYEAHGALALEVGHNSVADWCISIYDRHGKRFAECATPEIHVQRATRKLAFAEAYTKLAEYLSENRGGF